MTVIDVHTHSLNQEWVDLIAAHGGPRYEIRDVPGTPGPWRAVHLEGARFMTFTPPMFDYEMRIAAMNDARVDIAVVSLTCPNVFFGDQAVSLRAARVVNDDMAAAQATWPDRIRWFASLPWQYPDAALDELARACDRGAVGVMVLGNIAGEPLTAERFARIWEAIDRRGLPVLVHPTAPAGVATMDMHRFGLVASIGFMFDTTLAIARMVYSGFLDRYPRVKIIAAHGGAALPYLVGRMDILHERNPTSREHIALPPSEYLSRIWYDSVVYRQDALQMCIDVAGSANVMFGSDYPHNIGDMRGILARVNGVRADDRRRIRGENARRVFKL